MLATKQTNKQVNVKHVLPTLIEGPARGATSSRCKPALLAIVIQGRVAFFVVVFLRNVILTRLYMKTRK